MKTRSFWLTTLIVLLSTFAYSQTLTEVDPNEGEQCQRLTLTVTGENTNFYQGTSSLWLDHDGTHIGASSETVINTNQIVGEFFFNPQHQTGNYDVRASNGSSANLILEDGFLLTEVINLPILTSNDPDSANMGETILMDIYGDYTHFTTAGISNSAWLNSTNGGYLSAYYINVIDSNHIQANFSFDNYDPAGSYNLHVENNLDGELILAGAIVLIDVGNSPEIVSVDPISGAQGESLTLTVTGQNTMFQQGSAMVRLIKEGLGYIYPSGFNVLNDTVITGDFVFNFNHNPGIYDVTVTNFDLGDVTLVDGFELLASAGPPNLVSISPDTAFQGTAITLIIRTENTHFNDEENTPIVWLNQGYEELWCRDLTVVDSVTLEARYVFSYSNLTGYRDLKVQSPLEGTLNFANSFWLNEAVANPVIVSVMPDSATQKDILTISVTGKDIVFMQGSSNLRLTQGNLTISPSSETVVNDTLINGEFDFLDIYPFGKYDVKVEGGYAWPDVNLIDGFTLKLFDFINENGSPSLLTVYPNPSNGLLNVKRNFKDSGEFLLTVYDINGHLILEDRIEINENEKQLNLTNLSKGTYLLKVKFGENVQIEQFMIK